MRYNWLGNIFIQTLTQKNANTAHLHRSHHIPFYIINILSEGDQKTVP